MKDAFIKYLKFEKRLSNHTVISYDTDLNQFKSFFQNILQRRNESADKRAIRSWIIELSLKNYLQIDQQKDSNIKVIL